MARFVTGQSRLFRISLLHHTSASHCLFTTSRGVWTTVSPCAVTTSTCLLPPLALLLHPFASLAQALATLQDRLAVLIYPLPSLMYSFASSGGNALRRPTAFRCIVSLHSIVSSGCGGSPRERSPLRPKRTLLRLNGSPLCRPTVPPCFVCLYRVASANRTSVLRLRDLASCICIA